MKGILLALLTTFSFAFNWNSIVGAFKKTVNTLSYTIETSGINPRVYEFTPKANPNKICVVVFGNSKSGISIPAMQCFDKKIQDR